MLPLPNNCGIGLRPQHYNDIIHSTISIPWVEIHPENFFILNDYHQNILEKIANKYPFSFHCIGLSLGSSDELNTSYLKNLYTLATIYKPSLISDHLAWGSVEGLYLHDLLPLPYNATILRLFCDKINKVRDYLGQQILIENPSLYVNISGSTMEEIDFLNQISIITDCGILLDINNLFINANNLSYNPIQYIDNINAEKVKEIHLAGFETLTATNLLDKVLDNKAIERTSTILIDTHSKAPAIEVLNLFEYFINKYGTRPTLFEQDQNIPELSVLLNQAEAINKILNKYDS